MKILVVGASGFLGRNVVQGAARRGWDTVGVYYQAADFPRFAGRYGCDAVRHDLLGPNRHWSADACVYLAGNTDHGGSVRAPLDDLRKNVEALNRFVRGYSGGIVFLSSGAVYEGHSGPVSPRTCIQPRLPYAISKMACERYLAHYVAIRRVEWATVLRLYYAFGPHDRETRLIPRLVRAGESTQSSFSVTAPRGSLVDPLYVDDVVDAILAAVAGAAANETLDLCRGEPSTVPALVRRALAAQRWKLRIETRPRPGETPLRFHSSPRLIRRKLRLRPFRSFEDGLSRYVRWTREGG